MRLAAAGLVVVLTFVMFAVVLAFVGFAAPPIASAHAHLVASDPPANAALTIGPRQIGATFNEPMQSMFAAMSVVGPDGMLYSTGEPRVQGALVSIDALPLGPAGTYTVNYRVTSADGHVVTGSWSFRMTVPVSGRPGPAAAPSPTTVPTPPAASGGHSTWPWWVAGAVVVVTGLWWGLRRLNRR